MHFKQSRKKLICTWTSIPDVPQLLMGDPLRLGQVLQNLLGNALKFSDTGWVKLSVRKKAVNEHQVVCSFEVTDTGIGIPAEKIQLIFSPFSQADASVNRKYGGSGLGLVHCKKFGSPDAVVK